MTPEEAFKILDEVVNNITMNRASWIKIEEALRVIKSVIQNQGQAKSAEVRK